MESGHALKQRAECGCGGRTLSLPFGFLPTFANISYLANHIYLANIFVQALAILTCQIYGKANFGNKYKQVPNIHMSTSNFLAVG